MKEMTNKKKTMIAVIVALVIAVIILILALMGCQDKKTATPDEAPATLTTETVPQQKETENVTAENTEKSTVSTNANTENNNDNTKPTTTSSTTSKVENNKPVNSNTNTDNKKPDTNTSSNTSSNTSTKTWHEAEYKYVEHPAEYKDVWIVDKEAYTYEEPVYEKQWRTICNTCFADITGNRTEHGRNHMLNGENSSYHHEQVEIQTGTKTVEVPEEGHWETKTTVIKEAWTEKVLVREAGYY